jgi:hypothetical protein
MSNDTNRNNKQRHKTVNKDKTKKREKAIKQASVARKTAA